MPGDDLVFYGTTGPSGVSSGDSQPDATQWLGRFRASQRLDELESTLTANQADESRHVFVDSARIGDGFEAHQLKWIAIQTGPAALSAARVMSFNDATGVFKLDRRLSASAQSGDVYRLFAPNNVWPDVEAQAAQDGEVRYRCVVLQNGHGNITNANLKRIYLAPLDMGGLDFARFHQGSTIGSPFLQRDDDQTDLFTFTGTRDPLGGPDNFDGSGPWLAPYSLDAADVDVRGNSTWVLNQDCAIWLRRTIRAGSLLRRSVAVQVIFETDLSGSDPDPLSASAIMVYDVLGDEITGSIERDRYTHVLGGGRLTGRALVSGAALVDRPVQWGIRLGDEGTIHTDDAPVAGFDTTDEAGEVQATYRSPSDLGLVGDEVGLRLIIGAGEEVGNPLPRLTIDGSVFLNFATTGQATIVESSRSYLDDQATGFWPGF